MGCRASLFCNANTPNSVTFQDIEVKSNQMKHSQKEELVCYRPPSVISISLNAVCRANTFYNVSQLIFRHNAQKGQFGSMWGAKRTSASLPFHANNCLLFCKEGSCCITDTCPAGSRRCEGALSQWSNESPLMVS